MRGDQRDIIAALQVPWSTGPVAGHIHRLKQIKRSEDTPKVSWEGRPLGRSKKERNQENLAVPNASISAQLSAPQMTAQTAMVRMSSKWWRLVRSTRGSSSAATWSRRLAAGASSIVFLINVCETHLLSYDIIRWHLTEPARCGRRRDRREQGAAIGANQLGIGLAVHLALRQPLFGAATQPSRGFWRRPHRLSCASIERDEAPPSWVHETVSISSPRHLRRPWSLTAPFRDHAL